MTVRNHESRTIASTADADLILRTRSGDGSAFGELWRRHYPSGMAVARSITSSIDPDDLVQESYTRIYQAILKGGGPNGSFRAYLFTSIRNTAAAWGRARRETAMDQLESVADPSSTEEAASETFDLGLTAQAFRSLPARWQEVLWYTEVEQMKPADIAPLLGMKPGAVSQLAFRAREGLREAWIQAHLRTTATDSECHWTIEHLGAYSRENLSARDRKRIGAHLEECARCSIIASEAKEVSDRLALVVLPLVLGTAGAAGYTAVLHSGGVPVVAAAAMPGVVTSGVPVGGGGLPVGVDGASSASAVGTPGGAVTGIGALVGAGSVALVVAGVVAAATIAPGLVAASPVTSLPSAGDADNSAISSEVAPDRSIDEEKKLLIVVPDDAPDQKKDAVDRAPESRPPSAQAPDAEPPISEDPRNDQPQDGEGGDQVESPRPPVAPTDPAEPDEGEPTEPTDPGDGESGPADPDEGEGDPAEPTDPTDPADPGDIVPTAPVTITGTTLWMDDRGRTHYSIRLTGVPGGSVQALIDDSSSGADRIALDAQGAGVIDLRPTLTQLALNARVTLHYVTADGADYPLQTRLWALGLPREAAPPEPVAEEVISTSEDDAPAE